MKRREFITLLGAAVAWPLAARGQQGERMRRIGVLMPLAESDPVAQARLAAFRQALTALGWVEARNLRIEYRWAVGDTSRLRAYADELPSSHTGHRAPSQVPPPIIPARERRVWAV